MIANVESIEILLHVGLGRGIKYLSVSVEDAGHSEAFALGERLCVTSLKAFVVSIIHKTLTYMSNKPEPGVGVLCTF